ncbi:MAG TPA: hypothetical protein PKD05_01265 [Candidatus Melainabacteria bacterium]|nr:hypothetical protein [Candidatus Melainabacteria bacterium]HMP50163.1 hypothetical protein [Candidatus Melainabacteria bacterium]
MVVICGWLYVGKKSATFVADERCYIAEKLDWQILSDTETLEDFLREFKAVKEDLRSSYKSYLIEADERDLQAWFARKKREGPD